ncbi:hypothetical protein GQ53DRAFT_635542 [Thozetella sp. PMI_491]|nr:hypothetical protein GQ53DRAFT_635542 [Thozetella sp. PMI_491]
MVGSESYDVDVLPRSSARNKKFVLDTEPLPQPHSPKQPIRIGDSAAVWAFYDSRFKYCQQTVCKLIAKAWVKLLRLRWNSFSTSSGSTVPDWWPKPWGAGPDNKVRFKEPDHLYKKERVYLLIHILRLVIEPKATQHTDIRKHDLDVEKLEEVTKECLKIFFIDTDNPRDFQKKSYLEELFEVAKLEQSYRNGEIS